MSFFKSGSFFIFTLQFWRFRSTSHLPSEIASANFSVFDNSFDSLTKRVAPGVQMKMVEHVGGAQDHSRWVGDRTSHGFLEGVTASRLEDDKVTSNRLSWHDSGSSDKSETWKMWYFWCSSVCSPSSQVVNDVSVEVWHDHHVELLWLRDKLHASVVNDHGLKLDLWVLLGDVLAGAEEKSVSKLHDVGLVHSGDLLSSSLSGVVKSELGNTLSFSSRGNLEALNDTRNKLVLQAGVLSLGLLTNDHKVELLSVSRLDAVEGLQELVSLI